MTRASRARRIAAAAAYGGGGLGLLLSAGWGLLLGEAKLARRWVGPPSARPPVADGRYGTFDGEPLTLAMLGDSSAAGLGVTEATKTPGALIAAGLSDAARRPVRLFTAAVVGARSPHLLSQAELVRPIGPDVVVIMIGANDVTNRSRPSEAVAHLGRAVRRLRADGAEVVVCTCPDLGTVEPIAQPLRTVARVWSRQLAAAQTIAVVEAGGRTVSLGDLLGPEFAANPTEMFSADRFHPSAAGYAAAASVTLPSVCAALGLWPEEADAVTDRRLFSPDGATPVATAAARAAGRPGSEVSGGEVRGAERGPRGRWAFL
ncbi:MAG: putative secreted protein, partial [uncultured Corynebacteriales bacterium]